MNKNDVLKAFGELSVEDQQSLRAEIGRRGAAGCCSAEDTQQHLTAMMKMMESSDNPVECCQQMMGMCQEMMKKMSTRV